MVHQIESKNIVINPSTMNLRKIVNLPSARKEIMIGCQITSNFSIPVKALLYKRREIEGVCVCV